MPAGYWFTVAPMTAERKTPRALAGAPGGRKGSAGRHEQASPYPRAVPQTSLRLRTIVSEEGHFQGLEVSHD
jgi:hypothetical protein